MNSRPERYGKMPGGDPALIRNPNSLYSSPVAGTFEQRWANHEAFGKARQRSNDKMYGRSAVAAMVITYMCRRIEHLSVFAGYIDGEDATLIYDRVRSRLDNAKTEVLGIEAQTAPNYLQPSDGHVPSQRFIESNRVQALAYQSLDDESKRRILDGAFNIALEIMHNPGLQGPVNRIMEGMLPDTQSVE